MDIHKILTAKIIEKPFPHAHVKGLFDGDEFEKLSSFAQSYTKNNSESLYEQWDRGLLKKKYPSFPLHHDKDWDRIGFDSDLGRSWERDIEQNRAGILNRFGQKRSSKTNSYYTQLLFNFSPPKMVFPIHHDTDSKVWTIAYYLWPEKNSGTRLYDSNKKLAEHPPWEQNSGCAFSPQDKLSWHDYHNPSDQDWRCTLIINICRKDDHRGKKV